MTCTLHDYIKDAGVAEVPELLPPFILPFTPKPHQVKGLNNCLANNRWGLFDDAGCVSGDTEFLTPMGWKRIDNYQPGDKVCQFNKETETASFCTPLRYIQETAPYLVAIKGTRGTDQLLSPNHRVLLKTGFSNAARGEGKFKLYWKETTAEQVLKTPPSCCNNRIPIAFNLKNKGKQFLTNAELRVMVAVIAEGYFPNKTARVVMRLKKKRKIARLREILAAANIIYREVSCLPKGFRSFSFNTPRREKEFGSDYWNISREQRQVVFEEFPHWDGSKSTSNRGSRFSSTSKASADFIQFVCSSLGRAASLSTHPSRLGHKVEYSVVVRGTQRAYTVPRKTGITKVTGEAKVYCFTVPDSYLVLRRNGHIFVTGNCGKTMVMQAYALTHIAWGNRVVCIMPPILLPQFIETFEENFTGSLDWLTYKVINRPPAQRDIWFKKWSEDGAWPNILLMSYEIFCKLHHKLKVKGYSVVIADEAQKLRGSENIYHETVYNYTSNIEETALVIATGTPQHHTPVDCFAITRLINRNAYTTLSGFKRRHCELRNFRMRKRIRGRMRTFTVENIVGYKNLTLLNKNLYKYASRVTKEQVLPLKAPTIIPVKVELEPAHLKLYKKLASEKMLEIGTDRVITATEASQMREHLMHLTCNPHKYSDKPIVNNILKEVDALLDSIGPEKKIALYAHHNATVDTLAEHYKDRKPVLVYGGKGSSSLQNPKNVKKFQSDSECRMMISHPQSGGVGINLQRVCHYIIFVEPTPIQGDFTQVISRVQRMGQKHAVVIYLIKVSNTIYPSMVDSMLDNSDRAKKVNLDTLSFRDLINGSSK